MPGLNGRSASADGSTRSTLIKPHHIRFAGRTQLALPAEGDFVVLRSRKSKRAAFATG